jgi:O-antigen ligase
LYALANGRRTLAAWRNPAGILFGLGVAWAVASVAWSIDPAGSGRDLLKSAPMLLAALALPVIFDRPARIWSALTGSAVIVTLRLGLDLVRLLAVLGWPAVLSEARFTHPYLYTHPNVTSMMAGLCALVFMARLAAGAPGITRKTGLTAALAVDVAYLVVMGSRGPQAVFALAALVFPVVLLPGWRARLTAGILAAGIGWGLWQAAGIINPRFNDATMATFNNREAIWKHVRQLMAERPALGYGFGKKAFAKAVYHNPARKPPKVPVHYPHAHSYWLMLWFQGGATGLALWTLGWGALGGRLARAARTAEGFATSWRARLQRRVLPVLLATGIGYILVYGIGDFPDNVIRQSLFYLAGLAVGLAGRTREPREAVL